MIKKCDDCGIEIKTVAKCWGCKYFQKVINKSPKNLPKADAYSLLAEVRADVDLAIKLSKYVHDNCKDVPHDIGLKLVEIISEHFH